MSRTQLAVLGSPIGHSLSPVLHRAAYRELGLDWEYEAVELTEHSLATFIESRDDSWRGISLTMPLKRDIIPLLDSRSELVRQTGIANTVRFEGGRRHGWNTDVFGITESFAQRHIQALGTVLIVGGGATATSALVASVRMGARRAFIAVRSPERATALVTIGRAQGIDVLVRSLGSVGTIDERVDAVISTLPNGTDAALEFDRDTVREAALLDVAYSPWPSALASDWPGADIISGLHMLVLQALAQVRVFVTGDESGRLDSEDRVRAAMFASVGL